MWVCSWWGIPLSSTGITCCFLLQEMERTAHMFETFLWTSPDEWFTLSNLLLMSSLLSHSLSNCTDYAQSLGVKCSLTHSLSVEFGAIVSGTWNQPAYKNQTKLQKHVVFSTNKKYNPQLGDFGATETAFALPLFSALWEILLGCRPANRRRLNGAVVTVLNCWKPWATCLLVCLFFLFSISDHIPPHSHPG